MTILRYRFAQHQEARKQVQSIKTSSKKSFRANSPTVWQAIFI